METINDYVWELLVKEATGVESALDLMLPHSVNWPG